MIDVHCHLNFHAFEKDYDEVIQRAQQKGVKTIINTGTKLDSSTKAVELANKYDALYAIVGIHPHHADKVEPDWTEQLRKLALQKKVVAIGECGMDYYGYRSNGIVEPKLQQDVFEKQLQIAHALNLPLQIHNRQAGKDILEILEHYKNSLEPIPGMFHCFAGDREILRKALNLGFYIGFDGNLTYKGLAKGENTDLKDIAKYTPLDRIVTETDSPYLAPEPHRGSRNEPHYVILIGEFLAKLKGVPFSKLQAQTEQNAERLFAIIL